MSLVNDMLNDLDTHRDRQSDNAVDLTWLTARPNAPRNNRYRPLAIISLSLAIVAAIVVGWLYRPDNILDAMVSDVDKINDEKPANIGVVETNTLSDIRFSNSGDKTIVMLILSKTARYRLDRQEQQLSITLLDVGNKLQARDLKPQLPVRSMVVQQAANKVTLTLKLVGQFSYSAEMVADKQVQLDVTIISITDTEGTAPSDIGNSALLSDVAPDNQPKTDNLSQEDTAATVSSQVQSNAETVSSVKKILPLAPEQRDFQVARNARSLLHDGDTIAAEQTLSGFLQQQPLALHSGTMLASILLSQQRFADVEQLLTPLRQQYPDNIRLLAIDARLLLLTDKAGQAVDLLMSARPSVRNNTDYYELLALAARQNKQYLLSEQAYRGLLDSDISQGDWWVGMAIAMDAQGKILQAQTAYRRALKTEYTSVALANYARQRLSGSNSQ